MSNLTKIIRLYSAPKDSNDHKYFINLYDEIGIREQSIRELFWLFNAPARLTAFIQVISNLKVAIEWLITTREFGPHIIEAPFHEWLKLADYIQGNKHTITLDLGDHIRPYGGKVQKRDSHPMRQKGMTTHSLYTALWNQHENPEHQETFSIVQAHITLAHIKLMQDTTSLLGYENHCSKTPLITAESHHIGTHKAVDEACRCLRDLSLLNHEAELLDITRPVKIASKLQTPLLLPTSEFAKHFISLHLNTHNKFQSQMTITFGLYFQHVFNPWVEQKSRTRQGSRHIRKNNYNRHDGCIRLSRTLIKVKGTDIDTFDREIGQYEQDSYIEDIENIHLSDTNLAEGENESGNELVLVHFKEKKDVPYLSRLLAAEGKVRQTSLANQLLNNRWSTMTTWELVELSKRLHIDFKYLSESQNLTKSEVLQLETITILMIMLWTGSNLERSLSLGVTDKLLNHRLDIAFNIKSNEFMIKNKTLFYSTSPTATQRQKSRLNKETIHLPDQGNVGAYIKLLMRHKNISNNETIFSQKQKELTKSINKFLSNLSKGHRLNIHKISTYLFFAILKESSGDIVIASLATCTTHPLSRTQLHYSTHKTADIVNIYITTTSSMKQLIELNLNSSSHHSNFKMSNPAKSYFGSRLCPTTSHVQKWVQWLSYEITQPPKERTLSGIVDYHNLFTIFTSQMLAYATGIRAIKHPYIPKHHLDPKTGVALISDKDGDDCYNSRLVWLPKPVLNQLNHYEAHRNQVLNTLRVFIPGNSGWTDAPDMFLLDAKTKILPIQPKHIMRIIDDNFPFPLNVNRRYLRSHLIERGCPQEVVNSFMGHWARGEEPWGKYSTLSFEEINNHLKVHIPQLLTNLGWREHMSKIQL